LTGQPSPMNLTNLLVQLRSRFLLDNNGDLPPPKLVQVICVNRGGDIM